MLSRVAESLYWTARYVERAEDVDAAARRRTTTRCSTRTSRTTARLWRRLIVAVLGEEAPTPSTTTTFTAPTWPTGCSGTTGTRTRSWSCIRLARENARSVREQISGEMWEAINSLFLLVGRTNRPRGLARPARVLRGAPKRRAPLPGLRRRDDDARRSVRVHPARPPPRAGGDHGARRPRPLPDRGRCSPRTTPRASSS